MAKLETIELILKNLEKKIPDTVGLGVIRTNGLVILSRFPSDTNERMVAAMSAALLGTSKRTAESLFEGNFASLVLELDKGNMFLIDCGKVILVVITKQNPNVALVTLEMEDSSAELEKTFQTE